MTGPETGTTAAAARPRFVTPRGSLQAKFLRVLLVVLLPFSFAMLAGVALIQYQATQYSAQATERRIREGITEKARVLTENHALALSGLVADNAFGDVAELIENVVARDPDLIYGLFVAADGRPWAYASPTRKPGNSDSDASGLARFRELGLTPEQLHSQIAGERRTHLFGSEMLEFAAPVWDDGELLGNVRYGFSTQRMQEELKEERAHTQHTLALTLLMMGTLTVISVLFGSLLVRRALSRIAKPLRTLTDAADTIAEGRRDVRVRVQSGDELEVLATAFNHMIAANQSAFEQLETRTEQALEAARIKSEFLANVSHEIRTPMNGVTGLVKLMLEMPLEGKLRRYVETINASSTALLTIINDVLDFSKMEAGKYVLHNAPFEPGTTLQDVMELLGVHAAEKGIELVHRVAPEVPTRVRGDADRFRQVLNNLVGNAIKFTDSGEIFVELRVDSRTDDHVMLRATVDDTGIGVADADTKTIFDAFSQVDGSLVRRHGGTGLGLAISKHLVEMMGGEIGVSSRVGIGSQFWFTVRCGAENQVEVPSRQLPHGKSALLLEANPHLRDVIREHMETWGVQCEVLTCASASSPSLESLLRSGRTFDVMVAGDAVSAPELRTLMESLEANARARVPLLVISQSSFSSDFVEAGVNPLAHLHKPLRLSELYNSLQSAFSGCLQGPEASLREAVRRLPRKECKVLVVEDNEINRFVAAEQLEELGYEVDLANDGLQALERVAHNDYLAILMDCQMPKMDGYTASREIRKREQGTDKHQLIIALTAHAMASERQRVAAAGMDDYLAKPLRGNALERMLTRHTTTSEPLSEPPHEQPVVEACEQTSASFRPPLAGNVKRSERLMKMCQEELPRQVEEVVNAIDALDAQNLRAAAHKLKGAALAMGADPLAQLAERIQSAAEDHEVDRCEGLKATLRRLLADVERALQVELANPRDAGH